MHCSMYRLQVEQEIAALGKPFPGMAPSPKLEPSSSPFFCSNLHPLPAGVCLVPALRRRLPMAQERPYKNLQNGFLEGSFSRT